MTENEWVKSIISKFEKLIQKFDKSIYVVSGHHLAYANEVLVYKENKISYKTKSIEYETDILIIEQLDQNEWKPRIVIETKLGSVTTHDAITYSQKAKTHKQVHPYLRYGILIGNRGKYPLPGRLFRHGQYFDFMLSWRSNKANKSEMKNLITIIKDEINASRILDEILYNSRSNKREKFTSLHRPLRLVK